MEHWIMKSEPSEYSIEDLEKDKQSVWDGIRNYQVRNMLRDKMRRGDVALFYHSNAGNNIGVVGIMKIISNPYPDPTQFDPTSQKYDPKSTTSTPRWLCVDVSFTRKLAQRVSLHEMKSESIFDNLPIVKKGNRLSVIPITKEQFTRLTIMAEAKLN